MPQYSSAEGSEVLAHILADDGTYPNNDRLPLLVYRSAVALPPSDPARAFEVLFRSNRWAGSWRNGVYATHHYHSTAHEVLGVYGGTGHVQFGGPGGPVLEVRTGDVVVIPAGVAHCNQGSSPDFAVVGAYPRGQTWDMNFGRPGERPAADRAIARVPQPEADPIYGQNGPLADLWQPETQLDIRLRSGKGA